MSAPVTLPCPRIGMATNLVKAFSSVASVRTAAEFMCFPRVIDRPMPKNRTPNRARFIRSARSCSCSTVTPGLRDALAVHGLALDERDAAW